MTTEENGRVTVAELHVEHLTANELAAFVEALSQIKLVRAHAEAGRLVWTKKVPGPGRRAE